MKLHFNNSRMFSKLFQRCTAKENINIHGWNEQKCFRWCKKENLLSPIYNFSKRGGCWFCHLQGVEQLRILRKNHPELWEKLLKIDKDSPDFAKFKVFHTVADYNQRFELEDKGIIPKSKKFKWSMINEETVEYSQNQLKLFY